MHTKTNLAAAVATSLVLTACGGGGGSSSTPAPSPTPSPSTALQTSVPAPTYAAGSAELAAFTVLNAQRERCGFGLLAQNAALDQAAKGQTNYQVQRLLEGTFGGHEQTPGLSGFTASTVAARAALAGYNGTYIGEDLVWLSPGQALDVTGEAQIRRLMASVYHQGSLLQVYRDVGISMGFADQAPAATRRHVMTVNLAYSANASGQQPSSTVTYPCDGVTGVAPVMGAELPEPFSRLGFTSGVGAGVGHPIYVRTPEGTTARLTSASITAGAKTLPVTLYHQADDPNGFLAKNEAFVIPREAMAVSTTYSVNLAGTADGVAFSRSFSFSTRATQ
jgi:uncharacterized protein YkwD